LNSEKRKETRKASDLHLRTRSHTPSNFFFFFFFFCLNYTSAATKKLNEKKKHRRRRRMRRRRVNGERTNPNFENAERDREGESRE